MQEELKIPVDFDEQQDCLKLTNHLKKIKQMQNQAFEYGRNFIKSKLKTATEICEMIPNTLSELYNVNWVKGSIIEHIYFNIEYNRISNTYRYLEFIDGNGLQIRENITLLELLTSISGDSKAYFLDIEKKIIHLCQINKINKQAYFNPDINDFLVKINLYENSKIDIEIDERNDLLYLLDNYHFDLLKPLWKKDRYMYTKNNRLCGIGSFRHVFCLKTNTYLRLEKSEH